MVTMFSVPPNMPFRFTLVLLYSDDKRVPGSGFQASPKSPSGASNTRQTLTRITHAALSLKYTKGTCYGNKRA